MAIVYVYTNSKAADISEKLASQTGLSPTSVRSSLPDVVVVAFASNLTAEEKDVLDDFMSTRGYSYSREAASVPNGFSEYIDAAGDKWQLWCNTLGVITTLKVT